MEVIKLIINILEILVFAYLGLTVIYLLFFALVGFTPSITPLKNSNKFRKIAVLIPGYKEDLVIIDVAQKALEQKYPKEKFEIIIIADSFTQTTLSKLKKMPLKLVEVSFEVSTKAKALNRAMEVIGNNYDVALVLDADNIMEPDFLSKINTSFNSGYSIIQGHRVAKNINNSFAILDAISEEINNYIFRKAHRSVGLSAALIGSGMAFEYKLFKDIMKDINAVGGFDKQLEMYLLKNNYTIEYIENAIVEDEKVQKSEVFANQRRRWLSAQFIYFGQNIGSALIHLISKGNIDYFDKVIQMGQLPRIILLGLIGIITAFYGIATMLLPYNYYIFYFSFVQWFALFMLITLALLLSIPKKFYNKATLNAILTLPKGFILMFVSMLRFKGANKKFIHTQHGQTD
jgi:cellulose synthase/poly-beta-1,6-N-acetylglucosamine synthase-like glycosyltransferase